MISLIVTPKKFAQPKANRNKTKMFSIVSVFLELTGEKEDFSADVILESP